MFDITHKERKKIFNVLEQELNLSLKEAFFIIKSNCFAWKPRIENTSELGNHFVTANYPNLSCHVMKNIDYRKVGESIISNNNTKYILTQYHFTTIGLIELYYY